MYYLILFISIVLVILLTYSFSRIKNSPNKKPFLTKRPNINGLLLKSDIYIKLHNREILKINDNQKNDLEDVIDGLFPDFKYSIYNMFPMISPDELYLCYLIKYNLRPIDIAYYMCKERNTISMKQKRLACKMFGTQGTIKMLVDFIYSI